MLTQDARVVGAFVSAYAAAVASALYLVPPSVFAAVALAAVHIALGFLVARWSAAFLPALVPVLAIPLDTIGHAEPAWLGAAVFVVPPCAALVALAVGIRRRQWRRLAVGTAAVAAVAAFLFLGPNPFARELALESCARTPPGRPLPPGASGVAVRWTWAPPAWVCVYSDRTGRVLAERRSWSD